ncbi:class I SAM-dependent methyltransferase [Salinibacillus xinjiangensis]|uniref:Methyltransferase domain-containing protein n=1 Tax=Salinibacillus xinjiangensis TaxID=1229268 RepID=A0A6G1X8E2_9BACI|nr:class I SAM-dependent methyltransferase [Salinibacillus xinjiangensis]MRG87176.1 methyltransferase domain-containing protein [Salinibacillus xinjiangensis]
MKQNIYDNPVFFKEYTNLRKTGVTYNDFVEQPALKSVMPSLDNKTVLDLGCGTGQFAMYCIQNGASKVLGLDISRNMIDQAIKENNHEKIEYICMPIEDLELNNLKFDIIVSSLAIHYIKDYSNLVAKISQFLNRDGEFIFSIEHPIVTARKDMNNWVKDHEGNRLYWALDHYQEEGIREQHWYIDGVIKYHRTISTIINTLIDNGLVLGKMIEPQSITEGLEKMPKLHNEERRPSFMVIKAYKV